MREQDGAHNSSPAAPLEICLGDDGGVRFGITKNLHPSYISMFKINGVNLYIPPILTADDRQEMRQWKDKALQVERRLQILHHNPSNGHHVNESPRSKHLSCDVNSTTHRIVNTTSMLSKVALSESLSMSPNSQHGKRKQELSTITDSNALTESTEQADDYYETTETSHVHIGHETIPQIQIDDDDDGATLQSVDTIKGESPGTLLKSTPEAQNSAFTPVSDGNKPSQYLFTNNQSPGNQSSTKYESMNAVDVSLEQNEAGAADENNVADSQIKQRALGRFAQVIRQLLTEEQNVRLRSEQELLDDLLNREQHVPPNAHHLNVASPRQHPSGLSQSLHSPKPSGSSSNALRQSATLISAANVRGTDTNNTRKQSRKTEKEQKSLETLSKRLPALVKGFLTRRLFRTPKFRTLRRTILDTRTFCENLLSESLQRERILRAQRRKIASASQERGGGDSPMAGVAEEERMLGQRVAAQLYAAKCELYALLYNDNCFIERHDLLQAQRDRERLLRSSGGVDRTRSDASVAAAAATMTGGGDADAVTKRTMSAGSPVKSSPKPKRISSATIARLKAKEERERQEKFQTANGLAPASAPRPRTNNSLIAASVLRRGTRPPRDASPPPVTTKRVSAATLSRLRAKAERRQEDSSTSGAPTNDSSASQRRGGNQPSNGPIRHTIGQRVKRTLSDKMGGTYTKAVAQQPRLVRHSKASTAINSTKS